MKQKLIDEALDHIAKGEDSAAIDLLLSSVRIFNINNNELELSDVEDKLTMISSRHNNLVDIEISDYSTLLKFR